MANYKHQSATPWTVKEAAVLWDNPDLTYSQLADMLPGRTPGAVKQYATTIGARRSRRGRLPEHPERMTVYDKMEQRVALRSGTVPEIAFLLGTTEQEVKRLYRRCRKGLNTRRYVITDFVPEG